jgi:photosystem II stability/assembly factor-like uncharacterized protein
MSYISYNGKLVTYLGKYTLDNSPAVTPPWSRQTTSILSGNGADVFFSDANNGWTVGQDWNDSTPLILNTTNGGVNWNRQNNHHLANNCDFFGVYALSSTEAWAVGRNTVDSSTVIVHTTDGGSDWSYNTFFSGSWLDTRGVHFLNSNTGWISGVDYGDSSIFVSKTTNGGSSWVTTKFASPGILNRVYFVDANNGWACGQNNSNVIRVYHTIDGGSNWTLLTMPVGFTSGQAFGVHFIDSSEGWVCGTTSSSTKVIHTTNGGTSWTTQSLPGGSVYPYDIFFFDSLNGYCVGNDVSGNPKLWSTSDGGTTWNAETLGYTNLGYFQSCHFIDANTGWATGYTGDDYSPLIIKK